MLDKKRKSAAAAHFNFGEKRPFGLFDVHQRKGLILRQIFPSLVVGHQISGIIQWLNYKQSFFEVMAIFRRSYISKITQTILTNFQRQKLQFRLVFKILQIKDLSRYGSLYGALFLFFFSKRACYYDGDDGSSCSITLKAVVFCNSCLKWTKLHHAQWPKVYKCAIQNLICTKYVAQIIEFSHAFFRAKIVVLMSRIINFQNSNLWPNFAVQNFCINEFC